MQWESFLLECASSVTFEWWVAMWLLVSEAGLSHKKFLEELMQYVKAIVSEIRHTSTFTDLNFLAMYVPNLWLALIHLVYLVDLPYT